MMYLERLFASVGTRIDSNLIKIIANGVQPQVDNIDEKAMADFTADELKKHQGKIDARRKKMIGIFKTGFKEFVNQVKAYNYQQAVLSLLEMYYLVQELNSDCNYNALLTLCWVATRKYDLAEISEKVALKNPVWKVFDEIVDDAYESSEFFMADDMQIKLEKLNIEKKITSDLHWDNDNFSRIIGHLGEILEVENQKVWESIKKEELKLNLSDESTLEDFLIQLCDLYILPFYARIELLKIASTAKAED